jgi:glutathione synthase/RimK-type ligase-like ATP-grasp enzyme
MDRLNRVFGAIDIVVTPDGRYVFLEVNPAGQWAWFDDEITLPIRDAIVDLLVAGTKVPAARDLN